MKVKSKAGLRDRVIEMELNAVTLAAKAGVSRQMVSALLSTASWGRTTCSEDTARKIADALQEDMRYLFVSKPSRQAGAGVSASGKVAA